MSEQNTDLPAAAGSHQPCKGGVGALLAVMAAICVGMWWIAPDISAPRFSRDDVQFFAACTAAHEARQTLIITRHWDLDGGTCDARIIFAPSGSVSGLPGKMVTFTNVVTLGGVDYGIDRDNALAQGRRLTPAAGNNK